MSRFQFSLKTLLLAVVGCAICIACFVAGDQSHERWQREFNKRVEQLVLRDPDDAPGWKPRLHKQVNDVFHSKENAFVFAVDLGDGYMLRYELYEDGTYGYDHVPAEKVAAEIQKVKMPETWPLDDAGAGPSGPLEQPLP